MEKRFLSRRMCWILCFFNRKGVIYSFFLFETLKPFRLNKLCNSSNDVHQKNYFSNANSFLSNTNTFFHILWDLSFISSFWINSDNQIGSRKQTIFFQQKLVLIYSKNDAFVVHCVLQVHSNVTAPGLPIKKTVWA